ncbi:MAG TPA: protocatechuate 3,4-dioxygenase [Blastocatellia bacterium]|nr:protocatechuate 3,4-dioxygenase [Blastocatellia bacterium]
MNKYSTYFTRRHFLGSATLGIAGATTLFTPGVFAEQLQQTPRQTEGPFYPSKLPLDTDNDLLIINSEITPAVGTITHLTGRILNSRGEPIRNAVVEIWQCDNNGVYLHPGSDNAGKRDNNFQGFGRFVTGSTGEYYFRTIKPVPYPGRTPHIHFIVKQGDKRMLTTQMYIKGHPQNERDGIYRGLAKKSDLVSVGFTPLKDSKLGEMTAHFQIVVGMTPEEPQRGGPGGSQRG